MSLSNQPKLSDSWRSGMARTLFVSDVHLCTSRPEITLIFLTFLENAAHNAQALYILGDLFEYWAGDDELLTDTHHQQITHAIQALVHSGTPVFIMRGNRDVLLGNQFAVASGATLLADPTMIELYGRRILLTHGDLLCIDDIEYQVFRRQVHDANWQQHFLLQPLALRKAQIEGLRQRSEQEKARKSDVIMDVNANAVKTLMRQYHFPQLLIHGHTHRMARHPLSLSDEQCERIVLGDWYESGSYLECTEEGCEFVSC